MKLLLCKSCGDVFSLNFQQKSCSCGKVKGWYVDNLHAVIIGDNAIPIGFLNKPFTNAVQRQPEDGEGMRFEAFVIPKVCPTIIHKKDFEEPLSKVRNEIRQRQNEQAKLFEELIDKHKPKEKKDD